MNRLKIDIHINDSKVTIDGYRYAKDKTDLVIETVNKSISEHLKKLSV